MSSLMGSQPGQAALKAGYRLHLVPGDTHLVVLLGWVGAQDKTLAKYGALLTTLGVSHLRSIMPTEHVIWPFDGGRVRTAKLLLDTLLDTGLAERKLVLWAFSNGGTFVYEEACKLFLSHSRYRAVERNICGLIFDSAPSPLSLRVFHRVWTGIQGRSLPWWLRPAFSLLVWACLLVILAATVYNEGWKPGRGVKYWTWAETMQPGVPELYLFSDADAITPAPRLRQLVQTRKDRGNDVLAVELSGSAHCGHLKSHPAQYSAAVESFLRQVLGGAGVKQALLKA